MSLSYPQVEQKVRQHLRDAKLPRADEVYISVARRYSRSKDGDLTEYRIYTYGETVFGPTFKEALAKLKERIPVPAELDDFEIEV